MRVIANGLCAVFVAVSSQESLRGASQEPTLFPRAESPFSQLFKVPPTPAPKRPQAAGVEARPEIPGEIRAMRSRVVCGIKVIEGDPNIDSRIVIPIPEDQSAKIRVIAPPPCEGATPSRR
jgi:hypothetical protein